MGIILEALDTLRPQNDLYHLVPGVVVYRLGVAFYVEAGGRFRMTVGAEHLPAKRKPGSQIIHTEHGRNILVRFRNDELVRINEPDLITLVAICRKAMVVRLQLERLSRRMMDKESVRPKKTPPFGEGYGQRRRAFVIIQVEHFHTEMYVVSKPFTKIRLVASDGAKSESMRHVVVFVFRPGERDVFMLFLYSPS